MKSPPHPGDFIETEIVEAYGLFVTAAAMALRVSRPTLSSLLNGKAGLSGEMALRIEKAIGVEMDTLMRMWSAYEIAQTRKREKLIRVRRVARAAGALVAGLTGKAARRSASSPALDTVKLCQGWGTRRSTDSDLRSQFSSTP
jgi:addiction module HigA family antidote